MKRPIADREQIVSAFVKREIGKDTAAQLLGCTKRTLETYVKQFVVYKTAGLVDHRRSNNRKLTETQKAAIIQTTRTDPWRSPRNIRDHLELPVTATTIWRLLVTRGFTRANLKRVKAIIRFEAENPNKPVSKLTLSQ